MKQILNDYFNKNYNKLLNIAYRKTNDQVYQDIVQDTYVNCSKYIHNLKDTTKINSYVLTTLNRRIIKFYNEKKLTSENLVDLNNETDDGIIPFDNIKSNIDDYSEVFINDMLDKLTSEEKTIVTMTYNGYTSMEIAKVLNIKDSSVRKKLERLRKKMVTNFK